MPSPLHRRRFLSIQLGCSALAAIGVAIAPAGPALAADAAAVREAIARGEKFLADKGQAADGSFSPAAGPR
jgi:hypothetical protein